MLLLRATNQRGLSGTKSAETKKSTEGAATRVNIQRQPGANVIEVVDRVQALLPQLSAPLPAAAALAVIILATLAEGSAYPTPRFFEREECRALLVRLSAA